MQPREETRRLLEDHPRVVRHRADYVTAFLRQVRELIRSRPGCEPAVTFHGGPSSYEYDPQGWEPLKYNCDVATWIAEGLVDYLLPTQKARVSLVRELASAAKGKIHVWPDLTSWRVWGEELIRVAQEYYEAGADGLCMWDADRQAPRISEWAVTSRLGHREILERLAVELKSYWRRVPLKYLGGLATMYSFNSYAHPDPLVVAIGKRGEGS